MTEGNEDETCLDALGLFASGRLLPWYQPEPDRKVATSAEVFHWRCEGCDGQGADRPNPRIGMEPRHGFLLGGRDADRLLESYDLVGAQGNCTFMTRRVHDTDPKDMPPPKG